MTVLTYEFEVQKNEKLLRERGVSFEDVITILDARGAVCILDHLNELKYPRQKLFVVEIQEYLYVVPFERIASKIVLKTIYPSRKLTKLYQKKRLGEVS